MMAGLMALNALAIDIMLPGLKQIGASLGVEAENQHQFIITSYVLGFGVAQLAYGPLADRFGRKLPLLAGLVIYFIGAVACAFVPTFGMMLLVRFCQGLGAAATRVISVAIVRDLYGGRKMAEIMSLIMMVFMIIPVIAPRSARRSCCSATGIWSSSSWGLPRSAISSGLPSVCRKPSIPRT
nr:MFS transporter [Marinicella sp. W31]MDC2877593.1 MFS transporter [Marinicella sp. W31]